MMMAVPTMTPRPGNTSATVIIYRRCQGMDGAEWTLVEAPEIV
ncbi:unnamed protein product [Rhodiola kirilowii]